MSSLRPSPRLGCREVWREGGRRSPGSPAHSLHHHHPPATRRLGSPECPGCPGLAPPCAGACARSRGLGGPAAGTRIRGALWTPGARGPRAPRRPWPGRVGVSAAGRCAATRPGVGKPHCEPGACAHPRGTPVPSSSAAHVGERASESQPRAPGASLGTRLRLGPSPHFSGELVKAIEGVWFSLPTRVLSIVCHVFIPSWGRAAGVLVWICFLAPAGPGAVSLKTHCTPTPHRGPD